MLTKGKYRNRFSDEEIIETLSAGRLEGNMLAFFMNLPTPERQRLTREAEARTPAPVKGEPARGRS